ncbi:gamma-glutamyl-gamma-aminobutyrate hydrolase family protein [Alicyclobacillus sp. ALC3]|nr:gamma-glutamyl-gamma-aminobutyrate hydrolase family protein [Alicyclobacillus sp. ALC3]
MTCYRHNLNLSTPGPDLLGAQLSDDYSQGVEAAGGVPLLIPYLATKDAVRAVAERIDGLLLTGGNDVDPATYGSEPEVGLGVVYPQRDRLEIRLLREVMRMGKPVFGICRGLQLMNAAFGGTLVQDLGRTKQSKIQHSQKAPRHHMSHTVHIDPDSRIYTLLGQKRKLRTNSYHHQAVQQLAPSLRAVAWDDDGLIEAVEFQVELQVAGDRRKRAGTLELGSNAGQPFVVAVQWHPENLWRTAPEFLGLFRGLVEAAGSVPYCAE